MIASTKKTPAADKSDINLPLMLHHEKVTILRKSIYEELQGDQQYLFDADRPFDPTPQASPEPTTAPATSDDEEDEEDSDEDNEDDDPDGNDVESDQESDNE